MDEKIEKLFNEFLMAPKSDYPWNKYKEWKKIRDDAKNIENKKSEDFENKKMKDPLQDLVYGKSICAPGSDGAKVNELNENCKSRIKNFIDNPNDDNFKSLREPLNMLFNENRKTSQTFESRINRLASIFKDDCIFIPAPKSFENCCKILKKKYQLKIEGGSWLEKNKSIHEMLKPLVSKITDDKSDPRKDTEFLLKAFPTWIWAFNNKFPTEDSPNVIFYGAPGTGKTYRVDEYLKNKYGDDEDYKKHVTWIQFHPNYSYEDFIEGIKPMGIDSRTNSVKLELVNGHFKNLCIKAKEEPDEEFYFVADEINRANLSAVFGETLSLLEAGYRDDPSEGGKRHLIEKQYSALERNLVKNLSESDNTMYYEKTGLFGVPKNIRFIGMMNDVDKSIDAFDLALRRRFKWIRMFCDYSVINDKIVKEQGEKKGESANTISYIISCAKLNYFISGIEPKEEQGLSKGQIEETKEIKDNLGLGASYEFGHSNFMKITDVCKQNGSSKIEKDDKKDIFNQYLAPTLKEYLRSSISDEKEIEEMLDKAEDIFLDTNRNSNKKNGASMDPAAPEKLSENQINNS